MIGSLFLNQEFRILPYQYWQKDSYPQKAYHLRIFCKQESIDDNAVLVLQDTGGLKETVLTRIISSKIENYKILSLISGKKVFLQLKQTAAPEPVSPQRKFLAVPFEYKISDGIINGSIILSESNIKNLYRILDHPIDDLEDFIEERYVGILEKVLYQKLSKPPENFSQSVLLLPDRDLQLLLNHILHKNIASVDMLASYIYGLGDDGKKIADNLSRSVKNEVMEKVKLARLKSTYRWAEEVKYIIHRNLFVAARELDISIRGMETLDFMWRSFEISAVKNLLQKKKVEDWIFEFDKNNQIKEIMAGIKRKILTEALTFADMNKIESVFKKHISQNGVDLLKEDIQYSRKLPLDKRYLSLSLFYKGVKEITYAPVVKQMDFEEEVKKRISDGGAIDLIVDEIGFAKLVYALKNMPHDWVSSVLQGVLLNIYEDVLLNKIKIKRYDDYRIEESRREFLKALLILCDEEKI